MTRRWTPFVENIAESTTACLVAMVQGNLLALSATHWIIASRTGFIAGAVASAAILALRTRRRWVLAVVLGILTAAVDYFVHPGGFGPVAAEAIITGAGAATLSLLFGAVIRKPRQRAPRPSGL
jgi:hypothetical protein